jgi:serine/threonine protein kinase
MSLTTSLTDATITDPLDDNNFDVISFINSRFPTENSLNELDTYVIGIGSQISVLVDEISKAVQTQSVAGQQASKDLLEAQTSIQDLFTKINDIKLADFGLSALVEIGRNGYDANESSKRKQYNGLEEMWGTPTHYAPELIKGGYGPQADIWSLGCVLYEMLTGEPAFECFEDEDDNALYKRILPLRALNVEFLQLPGK